MVCNCLQFSRQSETVCSCFDSLQLYWQPSTVLTACNCNDSLQLSWQSAINLLGHGLCHIGPCCYVKASLKHATQTHQTYHTTAVICCMAHETWLFHMNNCRYPVLYLVSILPGHVRTIQRILGPPLGRVEREVFGGAKGWYWAGDLGFW